MGIWLLRFHFAHLYKVELISNVFNMGIINPIFKILFKTLEGGFGNYVIIEFVDSAFRNTTKATHQNISVS